MVHVTVWITKSVQYQEAPTNFPKHVTIPAHAWHMLTFKVSFTANVKRQLVPRDQVSLNLRFSVSYSVLTYVAGSFGVFVVCCS